MAHVDASFGERRLYTTGNFANPSSSTSPGRRKPPEVMSSGNSFRGDDDSELARLMASTDVISPHLLQVKSDARQQQEHREERRRSNVSMHKLDTEADDGDGIHSLLVKEERSPSSSPLPLPEPSFEPYVVCLKTRSETSESNDSMSSEERESRPPPRPLPHARSGRQEVPPARVHHHWGHYPAQVDFQQEEDELLEECSQQELPQPSNNGNDEEEAEDRRGIFLISPNHSSPQAIGRTRPVLPPPVANDFYQPPSSPLNFPSHRPPNHPSSSSNNSPPASKSLPQEFLSSHYLQSQEDDLSSSQTQMSPPSSSPSSLLSSRRELHSSLHNQRTHGVTFLQCKAGKESGKFSVDYLGMKATDLYLKSINVVARELATLNQRPREILVYVTSEKVRFAPPNSATLFQSFAIRDILLVRKCSKNRRIVGIVVWKHKKETSPTCHIVRCQDNLVATSLSEALLKQTQKIDDVPLNLVG